MELPPFVSLNGPSAGSGLLGVDFAPYVVRDPSRPIENLELPSGVTRARFDERLALLSKLETRFQSSHRGGEAEGHWATVDKAIQLMRSRSIDAFDVSLEKERLRESFGLNAFGQGCLAARRLVERGVRYVEVELGGWDTHQNNFETTRSLMATLDPAMSSLIRDLRERGLLESTLVVWMGEFGRTPRINNRGGRDHYPKAWSVALAGGGVEGGQVVGATDIDGHENSGAAGHGVRSVRFDLPRARNRPRGGELFCSRKTDSGHRHREAPAGTIWIERALNPFSDCDNMLACFFLFPEASAV